MTKKKFALVMGLNYEGQRGELRGCINDADNLIEVLTKVYKYDRDNIVYMTDKTKTKPTKNNIIKALYNIVLKANAEKADEIFLSYSGHGSHTRDRTGDEDDNNDECLIPLDYSRSGVITDDLMHDIISKLNKDTKCTILMDCCESSTMMDLQYRYIGGVKSVIENKKNKVSSKNIIMVSGCQDGDTSADCFVPETKEFAGACTDALLHVLKEHNYNITCYKLLKHMRERLKSRGFKQVPQITCSRQLDENTVWSYVNEEPESFMTN